MSFLDKIRACNEWTPADYLPLVRHGERLGHVRRATADTLLNWPGHFRVRTQRIDWIDAPDDFAACTAILDEVVDGLVESGAIPSRHGERYPVTAGARGDARCLIDRAAAPFFGARAFGQHLNGFVRTARGIEMWVGRRAANRLHYPGRLDNLVAGGLPHGISLVENLRKECAEEAGMPPALADGAVAVGAVTYCRDSDRGLKPDVMFCYDLELPEDFVPRCTDGEVDAFYRLPIDEIKQIVGETDAFKLNCNLVIIDFLVRHGLICQDDPEYVALVQGLRSPLPPSAEPATPNN
jgi:8-oxo-dGTP pyrophosphatase MutT (NUDIX family)